MTRPVQICQPLRQLSTTNYFFKVQTIKNTLICPLKRILKPFCQSGCHRQMVMWCLSSEIWQSLRQLSTVKKTGTGLFKSYYVYCCILLFCWNMCFHSYVFLARLWTFCRGGYRRQRKDDTSHVIPVKIFQPLRQLSTVKKKQRATGTNCFVFITFLKLHLVCCILLFCCN